MSTLAWVVITVVVLAIGGFLLRRSRSATAGTLADSRVAARRWVERLGGQVYSLEPRDVAAARQALADAAERFTAAGAQVDVAASVEQFRQAEITAQEGLYYVRGARVALGLDPGPDLPVLPGQRLAGEVSADRSVTVDGHEYQASPAPGGRTPHYYPGGTVAGRPVPRGWYSDPWWQLALASGVWSASGYLVASSLFYGTAGLGWDATDSGGEGNDDPGHDVGDGTGGSGDYVSDPTGSDIGAYGDY